MCATQSSFECQNFTVEDGLIVEACTGELYLRRNCFRKNILRWRHRWWDGQWRRKWFRPADRGEKSISAIAKWSPSHMLSWNAKLFASDSPFVIDFSCTSWNFITNWFFATLKINNLCYECVFSDEMWCDSNYWHKRNIRRVIPSAASCCYGEMHFSNASDAWDSLAIWRFLYTLKWHILGVIPVNICWDMN